MSARATVLIFSDGSSDLCGLARVVQAEGQPSRNSIVLVDSEGVTNWMAWSGAPTLFSGAGLWEFSDRAWRLDDPAQLGVAGQLGLFSFEERAVKVSLQTFDDEWLDAPWIQLAQEERPGPSPEKPAPDRWIRRLWSGPERAWTARRTQGGAGRTVDAARVSGTISIDGSRTSVDARGWIETRTGPDPEPLVDESCTLSIRAEDASGFLGERLTIGSVTRARGTLRGGEGPVGVQDWTLDGKVPALGTSSTLRLHARAGQAEFEWTGEGATLVSEPVQSRGRYATRHLVRFSRNGKHAGIGSFLVREYP